VFVFLYEGKSWIHEKPVFFHTYMGMFVDLRVFFKKKIFGLMCFMLHFSFYVVYSLDKSYGVTFSRRKEKETDKL
jgi:hypothetical protein